LHFQGRTPIEIATKIAVWITDKIEGAGGHNFRRLLLHTRQCEEITVQSKLSIIELCSAIHIKGKEPIALLASQPLALDQSLHARSDHALVNRSLRVERFLRLS